MRPGNAVLPALVALAAVTAFSPSRLDACDPSMPPPAGGGSTAPVASAPGAPAWSHLMSVGSNNYNSDCNPWVTAGGTKLFFIAWDDLVGPPRPGYQGSWDICVSIWNADAGDWGPASNLGPPVNTPLEERRPTTTADGDTLLFARRAQIYVSIHTGAAWSEPVSLFPGTDPCLTADARRLYYVRNNDIWIADRGASIFAWGNFRSLPGPVNTPDHAEVRPYIARDGTRLFWSDFGGTPRPGGYGGPDIWFSTWTGSAWGEPANFGPPVNTDMNTCTPYLSADGRSFYTSSGAFEGGRGEEDVWVAYADSFPQPPNIHGEPGEWAAAGELEGAWNVYEMAEGADGALYAATYAVAATGPSGRLVFRSRDAGGAWEPAAPLAGALIAYSVLAASDGSLYAGTYPEGDVFRSTDGGDAWLPTADLPGATTVRALLETRTGSILAGTAPSGALFSTTDAGQSWQLLATIPVGSIDCLLETGAGLLFAGGGGPPFRSTNGGHTWTPLTNFPFPPDEKRSIESLLEARDGTLWATGWVHTRGGYVFKSTNAGAAWDTTATVRMGPVRAGRIYAIDEDEDLTLRVAYQPGPEYIVQRSTDRGASWQVDGWFPGAFEGLAFFRTAAGALYAATTPQGDIFRRFASEAAPPGAPGRGMPLALSPGAPNPAAPATSFAFRVGRAGAARADVVDAGGRHVRTLLAGPVAAGDHALRWDGLDEDGARVPSGVYFCRLSVEGRLEAQKITVVR